MDYNKVIIAGRLTANPEIKHLPNGTPVCNFRIAANRKWKDPKTSETREDACFIDVDAYNKTATFVSDWFAKGSQILVEGRLKHHVWQAKDGDKRSRHSIVADNLRFVDPANRKNGASSSAEAEQGGTSDTTAPDVRLAAPAAAPAAPLNAVAQRQRERVLVAAGAVEENEQNIPF